jgi:hypothetical protein
VKIKLESLAVELAVERIDSEQLKALDDVIRQVVQLKEEDDQQRHHRLIELEKRFHRIILQAAQNPILEEFLDNLHYRCARLWSSSLSQVVPNGGYPQPDEKYIPGSCRGGMLKVPAATWNSTFITLSKKSKCDYSNYSPLENCIKRF